MDKLWPTGRMLSARSIYVAADILTRQRQFVQLQTFFNNDYLLINIDRITCLTPGDT